MSGQNGNDALPGLTISGPGEERGGALAGMVEMVIGQHEGKVLQKFRRPMDHVLYEPVNAALVGRELINQAVKAGAHVSINVPRIKISREKRQAMIARIAQIVRSMVDEKKDPLAIGQNVLDQVLNQIENLG